MFPSRSPPPTEQVSPTLPIVPHLYAPFNRATYEQRFDAALMDRLRSELSGGLEHLCLRMMSGARGLAEEGRNFTESPEALGTSPFPKRLTFPSRFLERELA